jgi:DNA-directed RNA polymerase alpha subunit
MLSVRTSVCLRNLAIATIADAMVMPDDAYLRTPNFGRKSLRELRDSIEDWKQRQWNCKVL